MNDTQRLLQLINCEVGSIATLSGGFNAYREREYIEIGTRIEALSDDAIVIKTDGLYVAGSVQLEIHKQHASEAIIDHHPSAATFDAKVVEGHLLWRRWTDGDRMIPFGSENSVLISDLLTNAKIPHTHRKEHRVLADNNGILWLCGIRPAERTRVTSSTHEVLSIRQSMVIT